MHRHAFSPTIRLGQASGLAQHSRALHRKAHDARFWGPAKSCHDSWSTAGTCTAAGRSRTAKHGKTPHPDPCSGERRTAWRSQAGPAAHTPRSPQGAWHMNRAGHALHSATSGTTMTIAGGPPGVRADPGTGNAQHPRRLHWQGIAHRAEHLHSTFRKAMSRLTDGLQAASFINLLYTARQTLLFRAKGAKIVRNCLRKHPLARTAACMQSDSQRRERHACNALVQLVQMRPRTGARLAPHCTSPASHLQKNSWARISCSRIGAT